MTAAGEALSQLAGVIGGFMFAGIVVLLSQPKPSIGANQDETGSARLRALTPFMATFVAMSLNAYVFGLISGERGDSCRRIWTAAAVASGMLAIGTVAAVCGIVLLVRAYCARSALNESDCEQLERLEVVLRVILRLLAVVAPALLLQRVYEYLRVWYDGNLHGLGWLWIFVVIITCVSVVLVTDRPASNKLDHYDSALKYAAILTILYSVAGTALVGLFMGVITNDWVHVPPVIPWTVATFVVVLPFAAIGAYLYAIRGITRLMERSGHPEVGHDGSVR